MSPLSDINAQNAFIEAFLPRLEDSQVIENCSNVCRSLRKRIFDPLKLTHIELTKLFIEKVSTYLSGSYPELAVECRALYFTKEETANLFHLKQLKEALKTKVQGLAWILEKLKRDEFSHFQQNCKMPLALTHFQNLSYLVELHYKYSDIKKDYARNYHLTDDPSGSIRKLYLNRLLEVSQNLYQRGYFSSCLLLADTHGFPEIVPYAFRKVAKAMPTQAFIPLVQALQLDNSDHHLYEIINVLYPIDPYRALEFALKMSDDEFPVYQIRAFDHIINQFSQLATLEPVIKTIDQLREEIKTYVCYFLMVALVEKFEDVSKAEAVIEYITDPHDKSFLYAHLSLSSIYTMADIDQSLTLLNNVHSDYEIFRAEVQLEIVRFLTKEGDWKRALTLTEAIEELEFKDMALALISVRLHKIDFEEALKIAKQISSYDEKCFVLIFLIEAIYKKDPTLGFYIFLLIQNDNYWPIKKNIEDFKSKLVQVLPSYFLKELIRCSDHKDNSEATLVASSLFNQILPLIALCESNERSWIYDENQNFNRILVLVKRLPQLEQTTLLSDMCDVLINKSYLTDKRIEVALTVALQNTQPMRNQSLFRIALTMLCQGKCPLSTLR